MLAKVLTGQQCLRISEAARLKGSDFDLEQNLLHVAPSKGKKAVSIPLLGPTKRFAHDWQQGRFRKKVARQAGSRGLVTFQSTLQWRKGLLFPSRNGAGIPHLSKDVIGKAQWSFKMHLARSKQRFFDVLIICFSAANLALGGTR